MGYAHREGFTLTPRAEEADVIVVNTCCFIEPARQESIDTILEMARLKETGRCKRLVVAGCLVQRHAEELRRSLPEVDAFIGLDQLDRVVDAIRTTASAGPVGPRSALGRQLPQPEGPASAPVSQMGKSLRRCKPRHGAAVGPGSSASVGARAPAPSAESPTSGMGLGRSTWIYGAETPRRLAGPPWTAYLKISEGCDNPCSFCSIPAFRGAHRSRPLEDIVREAGRLAASGVRELNLIAQDSTLYGRDLGLRDGPARLLRALNKIRDLKWIRLFYLYPNRVSRPLLEAIAGCDRVVKYIDIPLQSASRAVLARMKRGGGRREMMALVGRMRRAVPGLAIRTAFIVGFPGETEREFRETLGLVREAEFDHVGVFAYSHEEETAVHEEFDDDVAPEVKEERQARLMAAQEKIALRRNRSRIGKTLEVLCEGTCPETDLLLAGRMASQAPEIDGSVLINDGMAAPGEFVRVTITQAHPFDLVGRVAAGPQVRSA